MAKVDKKVEKMPWKLEAKKNRNQRARTHTQRRTFNARFEQRFNSERRERWEKKNS